MCFNFLQKARANQLILTREHHRLSILRTWFSQPKMSVESSKSWDASPMWESILTPATRGPRTTQSPTRCGPSLRVTRDNVYVLVQVQELKKVTGSVNTMVGNNEGSLMTGVKFPNLLGRGERLQADYTYGTKKSSSFNISLLKPLRGRMKSNLTGNIYQSTGEYPTSGFKELDRFYKSIFMISI